MQDLNDTNSVPSDVIASLYQNVSRESELGAGDIHNIIDVLICTFRFWFLKIISTTIFV